MPQQLPPPASSARRRRHVLRCNEARLLRIRRLNSSDNPSVLPISPKDLPLSLERCALARVNRGCRRGAFASDQGRSTGAHRRARICGWRLQALPAKPPRPFSVVFVGERHVARMAELVTAIESVGYCRSGRMLVLVCRPAPQIARRSVIGGFLGYDSISTPTALATIETTPTPAPLLIPAWPVP